jgi:hypothetical protein
MRRDLNRWFIREVKKVVNDAVDLQEEFDAYVNVDVEEFDEEESFLDDIKRVLDNLSELEDVYQDLFSDTLPKRLPKEVKTWDNFLMYGKDATCINSSAFWDYLEIEGFIDVYTREDGVKVFYFN